METLFRLALRRPAVAQDPENPSIELTQNTQFQQALAQALEGDSSRQGMKAVAAQFASSGNFIADSSDLALADELETFADGLDQLERDEAVDPAALAAAVQDAFGGAPGDVVQRQQFRSDLRQLRDSAMAIKLLPELHRRPLHQLAGAIRNLEVVGKAAADDQFPESAAQLRRYRKRSLALPQPIELGSLLALPRRPPALEGEDQRKARFQELLGRFRGVAGAIDELGRVGGAQLVTTPSQGSSKSLPPSALRPHEMFAREVAGAGGFVFSPSRPGSLSRGATKPAANAGSPEEQAGADEGTRLLSATGLGVASAEAILALGRQRNALSGHPSFRPELLGQVGFRLDERASSLSQPTRKILEERGIRLSEASVDQIVEALQVEVRELSGGLDSLGGRGAQRSFKRIGNTMVMISTPVLSDWADISIGTSPGLYFPMPVIPDGRIPHSHGDLAPAGVADLLVVKQQLTGYEAVDVAHIENVLKGERKVREHRRRRETEELTFTESEVTTTEERDLESTDRFEMTRETSETIKEDSSLKAGLTVSGKYGPTVEFSASAEGSLSRSKEQAVKAASKFSKEVTEKSSTKITERMLQRQSLRVTTEVEEKNEHTLDNVGGDGHVIGVYQWVEKVYEAQMFNYGLRTLYDFMVPEPGAFLIEALRRAHTAAVDLEKPVPFSLRPDQITEYNYPQWVREYGATDVVPPPDIYRTKSLDYNAGGGDDKADYNHSAQLQIDEGYRAIHATVGTAVNIWEDDYSIDVVIGNRAHRINDSNGWVWSTALDSERDSVPFGLNTNEVSDIAVAVEVKCQRTERALTQWRLDTHAKLTQAHRARLAEYEEKLAGLEVQAGIEIEGQSPRANLELMKGELKKACVSILSEQHYDLFDAIENGSNGLPQVDLFENEAEGPYVRFFEQAFEWEHMTWLTYPYFWGRKQEWTARVAFEDADPMFNDFLKAGYCRVVVPVREGFEGAIDHFVTFGEPWMGGPLPAISSPLFLPIADEIAERLDRPGDEVPEGEPWEVRLPTSLVRLRNDGSLPTWVKNEEGEWVAEE